MKFHHLQPPLFCLRNILRADTDFSDLHRSDSENCHLNAAVRNMSDI